VPILTSPRSCCRTQEQFRREPRALSRAGQIKAKDERSRTDQKIEGDKVLHRQTQALLDSAAPEAAQHFTRLKMLRDEALGARQMTVETCESREQQMREWLRNKIDAEDRKLRTLRNKPTLIRFRLLDLNLALVATGTDQDLTLTSDTFARLSPPVQTVFITENEINFLAFPPIPGSMVIFGGGYGFEMLAGAAWLHHCTLQYWGDIDTHGFAILDQLRAHFPHAVSLLMDQETLLAHRLQWGREAQPEQRELLRLTPPKRALYDDLRQHRFAEHLRLEQERIGFAWVQAALSRLR